MLGTFIDKLGTFFDQTFVVGYFAPALVGGGLVTLEVLAFRGFADTAQWWNARSGAEQAFIGITFLLSITIVAYLLQAFSVGLVKIYEGYWPRGPGFSRIAKVARFRQFQRYRALTGAEDLGGEAAAYYSFPRESQLIRPTQLGNVLKAASEHARTLYGLDPALWWPRLSAVLPPDFTKQVDAAVTPMIALLNLATILTLYAFVGGGVAAWMYDSWQLFTGVFLGGIVLAWICYRAAVPQARLYGDFVRSAFDLYRHSVLTQLDIAIPKDYVTERLLWLALNEVFLRYRPPWLSTLAPELAALQRPFYYDLEPRASTEPRNRLSRWLRSLAGNPS